MDLEVKGFGLVEIWDAEEPKKRGQSGVYLIVNEDTTQAYVGSSKDMLGRKKTHFYFLQRGDHHNSHLQRSYDKHAGNFSFYVVQEVPESELLRVEQEWIDKIGFDNLYNMARDTTAPNRGITGANNPKSIPIVQLLNDIPAYIWDSAASSERLGGFNNTHVTAVIKGRLNSHGGYQFRYLSDMYLTDEEIEILKKEPIRRAITNTHAKPKVLLQVNIKSAEILGEFDSARAAERSTGVSHASILKVAKGLNNHAGGYRWRFASEMEVKHV